MIRRSPTVLAFLLVAASISFHVWWSGRVQLSPQEAYYWQFSRHLDVSYFDHPPLAAWTIRAATELFGESERAIRLAAALYAAVAALFLFHAARRLFGPAAAVAALAVALATPIFSLGQSIITPDGPLLAGWLAALYFTARAVQEERGAWLLAAGAAAGFATLGKYTGWLLPPQILAALLVDARGRRLLRGPWPWAGFALTVAMFAPVIAWNARHDWVSFSFQVVGRVAGLGPPSLDPLMRFLGLEALLVTPILGGVVWVAAVAAAKRPDFAMRLCAAFALPPLALFLALSPFTWVRGNWAAPGYAVAIVAAAGFLFEDLRSRRGLALVATATAALGSAYLHAAVLIPDLPFPAKQVTTLGWKELAQRVDAERRKVRPRPFVLGCGFKVASALAYYLPGRPETWSSNAMGEEGLQYGLWFRPDEIAGREGILVTDRRERGAWCRDRAKICDELTKLPNLVVRRRGMPVTTFELYRCRYPVEPVAPR
ncbi:MAG TPA: glycosyltransferase family 39 protein [Anaeromyxobacteraceae bacterium]|nr:glycosyltransferase family 39 protein [Anaeromyxobacteraceae bacterium]